MGRNRRVLWIVLDSCGIGELPDAACYQDAGAATLQNMARAVGGLRLPHLAQLGLGRIAPIDGVEAVTAPTGFWGKLAERSVGKDTTTGHWEMAGRILTDPFALFPNGFDDRILDAFKAATGRGVLGNKAASGTAIIEELGPAHMQSGDWIVYTSADSVFQIAAHEEVVGLEELYEACRIAREQLNPDRVGRVIARPFVGRPGAFERTYNRHDFSMEPDGPTVLSQLQAAGVPTIGVGKIRDIFAGVGVERSVTTEGNSDGIAKTQALLDSVERGLIFVNLVDFDMTYGHRRDPRGYAKALEEFDRHLPGLLRRLGDEDLLILTADHGCDPTFGAHTDHTREYVPLLVYWPGCRKGVDLGVRATFADQAASVAEVFGLAWEGAGTSFLAEVGMDRGMD
jgi:phosphopentomutase